MGAYLYGGLSVQNRRAVNMDGLLLKEWSVQGRPCLLAVVCDGVGSLSGGACAASLSTRALGTWLEGQRGNADFADGLRGEVLRINERLLTCGECERGASTLSALLLVEDRYSLVHVGDSRIYRCQNGALEQLTRDDVSPQGRLTAYMGRAGLSPLCREGRLDGETFLLCSDGLYKRVSGDVMRRALSARGRGGLNRGLRRLVDCAIRQGEGDNISLAFVKRKAGG